MVSFFVSFYTLLCHVCVCRCWMHTMHHAVSWFHFHYCHRPHKNTQWLYTFAWDWCAGRASFVRGLSRQYLNRCVGFHCFVGTQTNTLWKHKWTAHTCTHPPTGSSLCVSHSSSQEEHWGEKTETEFDIETSLFCWLHNYSVVWQHQSTNRIIVITLQCKKTILDQILEISSFLRV